MDPRREFGRSMRRTVDRGAGKVGGDEAEFALALLQRVYRFLGSEPDPARHMEASALRRDIREVLVVDKE